MSIWVLTGLIGLALIDSMSIGTLFIPLWLLLAPGAVRVGPIALYLATLAGFYFFVGVALMAGADVLLAAFGALWARGGPLDTRWVNGSLLVGGLVLVAVGLRRRRHPPGPSRFARWRDRAMAAQSPAGLMGLALTAAVLEVATMLPYLGGIALIAATGSDWGVRLLLLWFYCLVMIAPAILLVVLRVRYGRRIAAGIEWFNGQMDAHGGVATHWFVGLAGVLLAGFAASRLFWP